MLVLFHCHLFAATPKTKDRDHDSRHHQNPHGDFCRKPEEGDQNDPQPEDAISPLLPHINEGKEVAVFDR